MSVCLSVGPCRYFWNTLTDETTALAAPHPSLQLAEAAGCVSAEADSRLSQQASESTVESCVSRQPAGVSQPPAESQPAETQPAPAKAPAGGVSQPHRADTRLYRSIAAACVSTSAAASASPLAATLKKRKTAPGSIERRAWDGPELDISAIAAAGAMSMPGERSLPASSASSSSLPGSHIRRRPFDPAFGLSLVAKASWLSSLPASAPDGRPAPRSRSRNSPISQCLKPAGRLHVLAAYDKMRAVQMPRSEKPPLQQPACRAAAAPAAGLAVKVKVTKTQVLQQERRRRDELQQRKKSSSVYW